MSEIQDDKAQYVVPFILNLLSQHDEHEQPFIIGLNGVQGAGKTVLVSILQKTLESPPHNLPTVVFSLDDFYLTHADQVNLSQTHPDNPLLQHRGQPSTHDIPLALSVFESLKRGHRTKIPAYDKAAFSGQGDRQPESHWHRVNNDDPSSDTIKVIIFEGWSVGFRPLPAAQLHAKHADAVGAAHQPDYVGRLGHNTLQSVTDINEALGQYDQITNRFDAFVHIDAADPLYVYQWRQEQEDSLRRDRAGADEGPRRGDDTHRDERIAKIGMTDDQVKSFVDGYYPAYELYTETLRDGIFTVPNSGTSSRTREMQDYDSGGGLPSPEGGQRQRQKQREETDVGEHSDDNRRENRGRGRQLRLVVGRDRKVQQVIEI